MCYRLWYNAPMMLQAGGRQHHGCIIPQAVTHSSAPEDGRDQHPKHIDLTGINKTLLLHLVGVYIIYINDARSDKYQSYFELLGLFPNIRILSHFKNRNTGLFISPSGISELDCATTNTDTAERSISIRRESLQVFLY